MSMRTTLRPLNGQSVNFDNTSGGVQNSTEFTNPTISVLTNQTAYLKFGDSSVTVSNSDYDIRIIPNVRYDMSTGGAGYCAIIQDGAAGIAYINEWTHKAI